MTKYPKKTEGQSIGSIAITQIQKSFAESKWESEEILKDYGSDLLIQIFDQGEKLPITIFAQVKGAKNIEKFKKQNTYVYSGIKTTTYQSWVDSNDTFVCILWDIDKREGVFEFIDQDNPKKINNKQKTVSIVFQEWNKISELNTDGFKRVSLEKYLLKRKTYFEGIKSQLSGNQINREKKFNIIIVKAIFLYLRIIGILKEFEDSVTLTNEFEQLVDNNIKNELEKIPSGTKVNIRKIVEDEIILSIVEWQQDKFQHPITAEIIAPMADILFMMSENLINHLEERYGELV